MKPFFKRGSRWARVLFLFLVASAQAQTPPLGDTLLNADFSEGNIGFGSDYEYTAQSTTAPGQEGKYTVAANPQMFNPLGASFSDHTPSGNGGGKMLLVNGALAPNKAVWRQTVRTKPGRVYRFGFWVASWSRSGNDAAAASPARLQVLVNGRPVGEPVSAPETVGDWQSRAVYLRSGAAKEVTITLTNTNTEFLGNDFALDDMEFEAVGADAGREKQ